MWTLTSNSDGSFMYLNDTLIQSNSQSVFDNTYVYNSHLVFGASISTNGQNYPYSDVNGKLYRGKLDELRIYNRSLTHSEISTLFNNFIQQPATNPTNIQCQRYIQVVIQV